MNTAKKVCFSFLITLVIFYIFVFASYTGMFSVIETRFYQPAVIHGMEKRLKKISVCLDEYTVEHAQKFSEYANLPSVKKLVSSFKDENDIDIVKSVSSEFLLTYSCLQGIRIIDSNGKRILFTTFNTDNYEYSKNTELPYEAIKANDNIENRNKAKIIFDNSNERILFSIPYYDNYDLYRGSIIFYVAGVGFTSHLIEQNILSVSEKAKLVATVFSDSSNQHKGFVLGVPPVSADVLVSKITELWSKESFDTQQILHSEDYNWFVISDNSGKTGIISLVFQDDILLFNNGIKTVLFICVFITLFLVTFLLFNLKQDEEAFIRDKIKRFKIALINDYLTSTDDTDWEDVSKFLAIRKHQINYDIKNFLGQKGQKHKGLVENLLEKTWDEVEQVIIYHEKQNLDKIESKKHSSENIENLEQVEEFEYVKNDEISELEEVEDVKELTSIDEIDDVEELENIEEKEKSDDVEEVEELEDIEQVEDSKDAGISQNAEDSFRFNKNNTSSIADLNFEVSNPDFTILDEENELYEIFNEAQDDLDDIEELEELEEVSDVGEIEEAKILEDVAETSESAKSGELESSEILPEAELEEVNSIQIFSLVSEPTLHFYPASKLEELQSVENSSRAEKEESIEETETGLFFISEKVDTKNVKIDTEFKNLVDSVLQNNI